MSKILTELKIAKQVIHYDKELLPVVLVILFYPLLAYIFYSASVNSFLSRGWFITVVSVPIPLIIYACVIRYIKFGRKMVILANKAARIKQAPKNTHVLKRFNQIN
ncbi:hypothetical protein [Bacillus sp. Marseille-P3800]|uniref:hypothetical protein n=1 Tax=Bacillus sp. Marseille-P3800 TaxID=2014782 RepID=UPI000C07D00A|nr:hypothetical protein [Bacillus sp. Marseille-P3800]